MNRPLLLVMAIVLCAAAALGQEQHTRHKHSHRSDHAPADAALGRARPTETEAAFLRRADTNGNGMIDEDEVSGQAGVFVKGILTRLGIELKYPIPLSKIAPAKPSEEPSATDSTTPPSVGGFDQPTPTSSAARGFGQADEQPTRRETEPAAASGRSTPTTGSNAAAAKPGDSAAAASPAGSDSSPDSPKRTGPKSGRFLTPRERLSKELPDWFLEKDRNGDGQIDMAEFATEWTPALVAEFNRYDLNHDGIITAAECLKVEGARRKAK